MTEIVFALKGLRLYGMAQRYGEWNQQGGEAALQGSERLLPELIQAEATERAIRSTAYQIRVAKFPIHRDLAGFDFDQSKVDRRQIEGFADLSFTDKAESIVLIGGTGTGKTHLATALLDRLTHHCPIIETGNESYRFRHSSQSAKARIRAREATKADADSNREPLADVER